MCINMNHLKFTCVLFVFVCIFIYMHIDIDMNIIHAYIEQLNFWTMWTMLGSQYIRAISSTHNWSLFQDYYIGRVITNVVIKPLISCSFYLGTCSRWGISSLPIIMMSRRWLRSWVYENIHACENDCMLF